MFSWKDNYAKWDKDYLNSLNSVCSYLCSLFIYISYICFYFFYSLLCISNFNMSIYLLFPFISFTPVLCHSICLTLLISLVLLSSTNIFRLILACLFLSPSTFFHFPSFSVSLTQIPWSKTPSNTSLRKMKCLMIQGEGVE